MAKHAKPKPKTKRRPKIDSERMVIDALGKAQQFTSVRVDSMHRRVAAMAEEVRDLLNYTNALRRDLSEAKLLGAPRAKEIRRIVDERAEQLIETSDRAQNLLVKVRSALESVQKTHGRIGLWGELRAIFVGDANG